MPTLWRVFLIKIQFITRIYKRPSFFNFKVRFIQPRHSFFNFNVRFIQPRHSFFNLVIRFSTSTFVLFNLVIRFSTSTFVLFNLDIRCSTLTFVLFRRYGRELVLTLSPVFQVQHSCYSIFRSIFVFSTPTFVFEVQHSFYSDVSRDVTPRSPGVVYICGWQRHNVA